MEFLSRLLAGLYFLTPPAAAAIVGWRARRGAGRRVPAGFLITYGTGAALGGGLVFVYAHATGGRAPIGQIALAGYVCVGVLCVLKGVAWGLKEVADRLLAVRVPAERRGGWWAARTTFALVLRGGLLTAFGLPYVMAVVMVYRPKVVTDSTPLAEAGFAFEPVRFPAADGVPLDGWWIPAKNPPRGAPPPAGWGGRTVVLCHGLGAHKANQLLLVRDLVPGGFNVLTFDFRAHGRSGGQVSSFGDLERRDVLGAVRWVRQNRPAQAREIDGLGISMGAAALVAAAADPGEDGRAIGKVAVYDTYDDLGSLTASVADRYFSATPLLPWLLRRVALPVAGAHAGTDLAHFSPAALVDALAPRPLLIVHARGDDVIGFAHGERLFDQASQPKLHLWIGRENSRGEFVNRQGNVADHNTVITDDDAAAAVRLFFEDIGPAL